MILDIDLASDFVCPWCFIGKTRLERAIDDLRASRPELRVRVNWLPFFLNPDTPAGGEPYRPFLEEKFGGVLGADAALARVAEAAEPDGLQFAFERIRTRPNTLDAHRLMYRAQAQGRTPERIAQLADALFRAHFQDGRDIGDGATLADIATACGERREAVEAYLESGADRDAVRRMANGLQKQGVSGVPFFIFNRRLAVSGAQGTATLGAAIIQSLQTH